METDERTTRDGDSRGSPGRHIVVAGTVIVLIMANRTDDRVLIKTRRQLLHVLREEDARNLGRNVTEFAADFLRSVR